MISPMGMMLSSGLPFRISYAMRSNDAGRDFQDTQPRANDPVRRGIPSEDGEPSWYDASPAVFRLSGSVTGEDEESRTATLLAFKVNTQRKPSISTRLYGKKANCSRKSPCSRSIPVVV